MTPEEQQQVNAAIAHMQKLLANAAIEGANLATAFEGVALENKRLKEQIDANLKAAVEKVAVEKAA